MAANGDPTLWAQILGWAVENIVPAAIAVAAGSAVVTAWLAKRILGKGAMNRIETLEKERDSEKENRIVTRAAYEARLGIVEAQLRAANQFSQRRDSFFGHADISVREPPDDDLLENTKGLWRKGPGAGRLTAKLVMMAPNLEEVRDIFSAHRAAPKKADAPLAIWAFLYRLEDEGKGDEVFGAAWDFLAEEEDIDVDPDVQKEFIQLREEWRRK